MNINETLYPLDDVDRLDVQRKNKDDSLAEKILLISFKRTSWTGK